jgi:hypothetical protein
MHSKIQFAFASLLFCALAGGMSAPASAGLVGNGTNTVSVNFWIPSATVPPPACDDLTNPNCENEVDSTDNASPTIPANFVAGALDDSTISVGDKKIVITNEDTIPFCSSGAAASACTDPFTGFDFLFSSGVDITGVSVGSGTASNFLPNDTAPHDGLQLLSPTEILVDVTGDNPAVGGQLILDVTTKTSTIPEPSTWMMMLLGFAVLGFAGYRRKFGQAKAARAG